MTSRLTKLAAAGLALAVAATAMPIVTPAEAGHHGWKGHSHQHYSHRSHRRDSGAAAAAGIIGFAAGAIIGSTMAQPRVYHAPPPVHYYPPVRYTPAPWTPDWYAYCASKYRSFDARSGTYVTYSGYRRLCQ
jgi:hypothetical protein